MTTQAGAYDNPSYLTRQQVSLGKTVAGANGTGLIKAWPVSNVRLRNVASIITVIGTSAGAGNDTILYCIGTCTQYSAAGVGTQGTGTTALSTFTNGTSSVGSVSTSGDLNVTINQGSLLIAKNGTDASGSVDLVAELHIDPNSVFTAP